MVKMLSDVGFIFDWIFVKLADNRDRHKILDRVDFSGVLTIGMIVTHP